MLPLLRGKKSPSGECPSDTTLNLLYNFVFLLLFRAALTAVEALGISNDVTREAAIVVTPLFITFPGCHMPVCS